MRTRAVLASIVASAGVLIVGWQLGAPAATRNTAATPSAATSAPAGATPGAAPGAPPGAGAGAKSPDGTWTGTPARTQYGTVQVQVTIAGGRITAVKPLQLTGPDRRAVQISNEAAPLLLKEVLAAQSANVSSIGGATYTSDGYLRSLQSALSQAGF